jgi:N-methylhydantoinase B
LTLSGVRGGGDGTCADGRVRRADGTLSEELGTYVQTTLVPGERLVSICSSGGGYGDPAERDAERVRRDVLERLVSPDRARAVYRVVITPEGELDAPATAALRAS